MAAQKAVSETYPEAQSCAVTEVRRAYGYSCEVVHVTPGTAFSSGDTVTIDISKEDILPEFRRADGTLIQLPSGPFMKNFDVTPGADQLALRGEFISGKLSILNTFEIGKIPIVGREKYQGWIRFATEYGDAQPGRYINMYATCVSK